MKSLIWQKIYKYMIMFCNPPTWQEVRSTRHVDCLDEISEAWGRVWRTVRYWLSASTQRSCHYGNKGAGCSQSIVRGWFLIKPIKLPCPWHLRGANTFITGLCQDMSSTMFNPGLKADMISINLHLKDNQKIKSSFFCFAGLHHQSTKHTLHSLMEI